MILAGCGRPPEIVPISSEERGLKELAGLYREFTTKKKRGAKSLKELNVKGQQNPVAVTMINSGDLVVQWGVPLSTQGASADAVLAYVKTVPEQGGYVLMQDGTTIKKITAEEFKAAPKASPR
jgi:hydrogenase maturation factor